MTVVYSQRDLGDENPEVHPDGPLLECPECSGEMKIATNPDADQRRFRGTDWTYCSRCGFRGELRVEDSPNE